MVIKERKSVIYVPSLSTKETQVLFCALEAYYADPIEPTDDETNIKEINAVFDHVSIEELFEKFKDYELDYDLAETKRILEDIKNTFGGAVHNDKIQLDFSPANLGIKFYE